MVIVLLLVAAASSLAGGVIGDRPLLSVVALVLAAAAGALLALPLVRRRVREGGAAPVEPAAKAEKPAKPVVAKAEKPAKPAAKTAKAAKPAAKTGKPAVAKVGKPAKPLVAKAEPAGPAVSGPAVDDSETIIVARGRRRYHRAGCELLTGLESDELVLAEARDEGFSPCTRCFAKEHAAVG